MPDATPRREYFTQPQPWYQLAFAPLHAPDAMDPLVTLNGVALLEHTDFYINGSQLIFTGTDTAHEDDPTVQIWYWSR